MSSLALQDKFKLVIPSSATIFQNHKTTSVIISYYHSQSTQNCQSSFVSCTTTINQIKHKVLLCFYFIQKCRHTSENDYFFRFFHHTLRKHLLLAKSAKMRGRACAMRSLEKNNKCCSIYKNSRVLRKNWVIRESKKTLGFSGVNRTASFGHCCITDAVFRDTWNMFCEKKHVPPFLHGLAPHVHWAFCVRLGKQRTAHRSVRLMSSKRALRTTSCEH